MDARLPPDLEAFRLEVRRFLAAHLPADIRARWLETPNVLFAPRADTERWQRILHERGWSVPTWPVEHGGPGWDVMRRYVFEIETALAGAPPPPNAGPRMIGPVLMRYGTPEQKARFLPRIASAEDYWCQGYSEPGSGSDLAALSMRAVRDGADYVVNGSKIWTTVAHEADLMFALTRTDATGRKQDGVTFLLFDMRAPGLSVRPLPYMTGVHEFNQVFFDDVRTPVAMRVGEEGQGWEIAKYLLEFERGGNFLSGRIRAALDRARRAAEWSGAWSDGDYRRRHADLETRAEAVAWTELRILDAASKGGRPGAGASYIKLLGAEMNKDATELAMRALGYEGGWGHASAGPADNRPPLGPAAATNASDRYFNHRANSIMGGTNEVQHDVIAKRMLGL
ncbi:MAG: acyl-CoA dehydrogenase family protein [Alphaproteobacteria bacterium]